MWASTGSGTRPLAVDVDSTPCACESLVCSLLFTPLKLQQPWEAAIFGGGDDGGAALTTMRSSPPTSL